MIILAIETSCDDTGVAVIKASGKKRPRFKILSNFVSSQIETHRKWGGVYPALAKREHQKNLVPALTQALKQARMLGIFNFHFSTLKQNQNKKLRIINTILEREEVLKKELLKFLTNHKKPKIDAIAITSGPGLEPCLWVGVNFAKSLAYFWDASIIPVNHIEAHIWANFIARKKYSFPAVSLIVSGGHTQLILMKGFGRYKILGETRDDAAGECFDKTAKILGLAYPGGPAIASLAKTSRGRASAKLGVRLPRPMIKSENYDFSFSGLKTAVLYYHQKQTKKPAGYLKQMCREIQQAIIDVLVVKTIKAAKEYKVKTIILGGGVAANKELRRQLVKTMKKEIPGVLSLIPPAPFCTDNAAMIGAAAYFGKKAQWKNIRVKPNLRFS